VNIRAIDITRDRLTLLEFRAVINYASANSALRKAFTEVQFREIWLGSRGTEEYLAALAASMKDPRTIAEIWEEDGAPVAYVWASFTDWPEYKMTGVEIHDVMVAPAYRRRGIATQIMQRVEKLARERGATLLRSGTGIENNASGELHTRVGFYVQRVEFEKEL